MRSFACLLLAASICSSSHAQDTSGAERVAQQNALFEEFYQAGLKNAPERATAVGGYRYNAQPGDASLAQIERADGDRPLHRAAGAGAGLQDGATEIRELRERARTQLGFGPLRTRWKGNDASDPAFGAPESNLTPSKRL